MYKKENFLYFLKEHLSLIILIISTGIIFLLNIFFKEIFNEEEYYLYSISLVIISFMNSFGLFGGEQTFLRLSNIKDDKIYIQKKNLYFLIVTLIISSFLFQIIFTFKYDLQFNVLFILLACINILLIMFFYNFMRLLRFYTAAQLINNFWKISLFLFSITLFWFNKEISFNSLCLVFFIATSISVLFGLLFVSNKIRVIDSESNKKIFSYSINFFIALLTLSFMSQMDKIFIENNFGKSSFNEYYYVSNFFLFPFSLFQTYIGFKELPKIKIIGKGYNLLSNIKFVLLGGIVFSIILFFSVYVLNYLNFIDINLSKNSLIILMLLFIGILKLSYSLLSAFYGNFAGTNSITKANILTLFSIFMLYIVIPFKNIEWILIYFIIIWICRSLIWAKECYLIKKEV